MSTQHKCTHIHIHADIHADMHASAYIYMYVYIIYLDESEGKITHLGILYLMRKKIINDSDTVRNSTHTQFSEKKIIASFDEHSVQELIFQDSVCILTSSK